MKKICVVTGTRADYGLLYWIMKDIQESHEFELDVIVTGMHLSEKFGNTWKQLEKDGFNIAEKIDLGELNDSKASLVSQVSTGLSGFFNAYTKTKPDLVLILGDRYEMFAAAQSAFFCDIPIGHIHGGEVTEGAFDDVIRHSITKMSSFHFTSTDTYRKRVIQMGEKPDSVFTVGAPGLESIKNLNLLGRNEFESELNFKLYDKNFLITYHPVTAANENAIKDLIEALKNFSDCGQIITLPNSDPGHDSIFKALKEYASSNDNVYLTTSLGSLKYLSALKLCDIVIGNSSSGIIEAPFMGTTTVNIGERQLGRIQAESVINTKPDNKSIFDGIKKAMQMNPKVSFIYGDGCSAEKIMNSLTSIDFKSKRGFYDL